MNLIRTDSGVKTYEKKQQRRGKPYSEDWGKEKCHTRKSGDQVYDHLSSVRTEVINLRGASDGPPHKGKGKNPRRSLSVGEGCLHHARARRTDSIGKKQARKTCSEDRRRDQQKSGERKEQVAQERLASFLHLRGTFC